MLPFRRTSEVDSHAWFEFPETVAPVIMMLPALGLILTSGHDACAHSSVTANLTETSTVDVHEAAACDTEENSYHIALEKKERRREQIMVVRWGFNWRQGVAILYLE